MSLNLLLLGYCLLIVLASLAGGWLPLAVRLDHRRMQLTISLVAGFMLGVAVLHMLPHALAGADLETAAKWLLGGLLAMFFIERFFAFHDHEPPAPEKAPEDAGGGHQDDGHAHHHGHGHSSGLTWTGAAIGMTLHSLIGGVALGSAVLAESKGQDEVGLAGLAVFLVIVLHKPLDSLTVITLAKASGLSAKTAHVINGLFALAVPIGAAAFVFGVGGGLAEGSSVAAYALAFSAGTFLCISLSDLLPELHFHDHDRGQLSAALVVGLALAWGVAVLEHQTHGHGAHGGHGHDHGHDHEQNHGHGDEADAHAGHDHGDEGHQDEAHEDDAHGAEVDQEPDPHAGHDHDHDHGDHSGHDH